MKNYIVPSLLLIGFLILGATQNMYLFCGILIIVIAIFLWINIIWERTKQRIYHSEEKTHKNINERVK